jgi:hypothetical protein
MRAICGAIIAAGAFIGLGLTALGIGTRYTYEHSLNKDSEPVLMKLSMMDKPLVFILVFLTASAIAGLGIAFVGLAYHHARREREHVLAHEHAMAHKRTAV